MFSNVKNKKAHKDTNIDDFLSPCLCNFLYITAGDSNSAPPSLAPPPQIRMFCGGGCGTERINL